MVILRTDSLGTEAPGSLSAAASRRRHSVLWFGLRLRVPDIGFSSDAKMVSHYSKSGLYPQIRSFVLPEDSVHLRNLVQSEKAAPHNGWPRWTIMLAREVTAEFCDP